MQCRKRATHEFAQLLQLHWAINLIKVCNKLHFRKIKHIRRINPPFGPSSSALRSFRLLRSLRLLFLLLAMAISLCTRFLFGKYTSPLMTEWLSACSALYAHCNGELRSGVERPRNYCGYHVWVYITLLFERYSNNGN